MDRDIIVSLVIAVFASTGFWTVINGVLQRRADRKKSASSKHGAITSMLLGLGHDRIYDLCERYIERGYITTSEYDNLKYLFDPYVALGGNGTGIKLKEAVDKLPVKASHEFEQ